MTSVNLEVNISAGIVHRRHLLSGAARDLYVFFRGDRSPAVEFMEGLQTQERDRLHAALVLLSELGPLGNPTRYRYIRHHRLSAELQLAEIRSQQVRMLVFTDSDGAMVLTNGFVKKRDTQLARELERAIRLIEDYYG